MNYFMNYFSVWCPLRACSLKDEHLILPNSFIFMWKASNPIDSP